MAINRTLVWILAGGAALALGGAAFWWWRRRAKAGGEPDPAQDIPPIPDPLDLEVQAEPREQTETKAPRKPPARGPVVSHESPPLEHSEAKLEPDVDVPCGETEIDVDQGPAAGDRVEIETQQVAVLVPKSRRKRYRVGVGDLIELRPDTISDLPADSAWQSSRSDVAVRVVQHDQARSVVALDGPAGEVNVALQTPVANGQARTLCSWKFQIVERAA